MIETISANGIASMHAFWISQKRPEKAKMTPEDLLTVKMVLIELPRNAKQCTLYAEYKL